MRNWHYVAVAVLFIAMCTMLSACNPIREQIDSYCEKSEAERKVTRFVIDKGTSPHKIRVECAKDGGE